MRLFVVMALLAVSLFVASPAQAAAVQCANGTKSMSRTVNDGSAGDDLWTFTGTVNYRYCRNSDSGLRWVVPLWFNGKYNFEGDKMSCNPSYAGDNSTQYVSFDPTFFDQQGNTHNPGRFLVDCDTDTSNNVTQTYNTDTRLFWTKMPDGSIKAPSFRSDIHVEKGLGLFEVNTSMSAFFSSVYLP